MILLSKTKLIIAANNEFFSKESAFLEGTNLEIYNDAKKEWKLYSISKNVWSLSQAPESARNHAQALDF